MPHGSHLRDGRRKIQSAGFSSVFPRAVNTPPELAPCLGRLLLGPGQSLDGLQLQAEHLALRHHPCEVASLLLCCPDSASRAHHGDDRTEHGDSESEQCGPGSRGHASQAVLHDVNITGGEQIVTQVFWGI